jgi:hypothetical protein
VETGNACAVKRAHTSTILGTRSKTRRYLGLTMCRGEAWRGRVVQALEFGEPGVADGTTADSLAAGCRGPRQDDQTVKTKPLTRNCLRILDQCLGPTSTLFKEPAAGTARHHCQARSRGGWTSRPLTPKAAHFTGNTHSGRWRATLDHALVEKSESLSCPSRRHISRRFPRVQFPPTAPPRHGRRALWPSLTDGRPNTDDPRHFGAASFGRIGRSKLGSIDFGIISSGAL